MRLIDANKLKPIQVYRGDVFCEMVFMGDIENAPTVDAEPVVRCKDCIYYGDHGDGEMACAMMILYPNKPTDYCSLGERREDAEKTD